MLAEFYWRDNFDLLCGRFGLMSGFGLMYGVMEEAGVSGGVGLPGTGLCW